MSDVDTQDVFKEVVASGRSSREAIGAGEIERLIAAQPGVSGAVSVTNLRGNAKVGASSGIVLFTADYDDGTARRQRDLVLRYAPKGEGRLWYRYNLADQFRVQKAVQGCGVPVPEPLWIDEEGEHLGFTGFVMTPLPGEAPTSAAFAAGPLAEATPADRSAMLDEVAGALAAIHRIDLAATGLADFAMDAPGAHAMEKCINWYWQTWEWIEHPEHERLAAARRWLLDNMPEGREALTHGDATLHNYLFAGNRLTGVLDWEMSCVARAENDLALQQITNELFAPPPGSGLPQPPSEAELRDRYARMGGIELAPLGYFKRLTAYMVITAIASLQRSMPEEVRVAQKGFTDRIWSFIEA